MTIRSRLRTVMMCLVLEVGVLTGVPMRPDEIRELMNQMNQPKLAHVLPSEDDEGNDPGKKLSRLASGV